MKVKWKILYSLVALLLIINGCDRPLATKEEIQQANKLKPTNSIPYNTPKEEYPYPNTKEGYQQAGQELMNPIPHTKQNLEEGKSLYLALCKHCHGENGDADAPMITKEKYPVPPTFSKRLPTISDGNMFHSITYGKNQMPANGEDFSSEQKWLLVMYIQTLVSKADY